MLASTSAILKFYQRHGSACLLCIRTFSSDIDKEFRHRRPMHKNPRDQFGTIGRGLAPQTERLHKGFDPLWDYDGEALLEKETEKTIAKTAWEYDAFANAPVVQVPIQVTRQEKSKERKMQQKFQQEMNTTQFSTGQGNLLKNRVTLKKNSKERETQMTPESDEDTSQFPIDQRKQSKMNSQKGQIKKNVIFARLTRRKMQEESKKKKITPEEKVKLVLQSRVEGYDKIGHLLNDLWTDFGVNGNELAYRFGFRGPRAFDLFLRSEEMQDICEVEDRADEVTIYRAAYDRRVQHIHMEMMVSKREVEKKAQIAEDRRARQMAYSLAEPCGSYRRARQNQPQNQRPVDRGLQSNLQSTETIYKRDARNLNTPGAIGSNDRPNSSSESNNHFAPTQMSTESKPNPSIRSFKDDRSQRDAQNEPDENRYRRNVQIQNGSSNNHFAPTQVSEQSRPNPSFQSFKVDRLQSVAQNMMDENRYRKDIQIPNGSSTKSNNHFTPAQISKELRQNPSIQIFNDDRSQRVAQNELKENRYHRNIQMQNGSRRPPTPGGNVEGSDEDDINDWDYEAPKRTMKKPTPKSNHIRPNDQYHFAPTQVSNESRQNPSFRVFNDDRPQRFAQDEPNENRYRRNTQMQNGSRRPPTPGGNGEESDEDDMNDWDYEAPKRPMKKPSPKSNQIRPNDQYHFAPTQVSEQPNPSFRVFNDDRAQKVEPNENHYRRNIKMQNGSRRPPTPGGNVEDSDEDDINDWDYEAPKRPMKKPTPKSNHIRPNDQYHFAPIQDHQPNPSFQVSNDNRSQRIAQNELGENRYHRNIQDQERVFPARNSNRQSIPIPPRARTEHPISFFARFGKDLLPKPDDGLKSRQTYR
ncbi:hypothetical protein Ddc_10040 [Ditylenchus destructor]|nr:hypothetical protein Ddc_10040 [Ditylenchus destructor]